MRKLWLIFAQFTTLVLTIVFVISTLRPDLLPGSRQGGGGGGGTIVTIKEAASDTQTKGEFKPGSFSNAAQAAMPSVVNVFTSKEVKVAPHPLLEDPRFKRFFGDPLESQSRRASSLHARRNSR